MSQGLEPLRAIPEDYNDSSLLFQLPDDGVEKIFCGVHKIRGKWEAGRVWNVEKNFTWYIQWWRTGIYIDNKVKPTIDALRISRDTTCHNYGQKFDTRESMGELPALINIKVKQSGVVRGVRWFTATQYDDGYPRFYYQDSLGQRVYGSQGKHMMYKALKDARYDLKRRYYAQVSMGILPSEVIDFYGNLLGNFERELLVQDRLKQAATGHFGRLRSYSPSGVKFNGNYTCMHNLAGKLFVVDRAGVSAQVRLKMDDKCGCLNCKSGNVLKAGCDDDAVVIVSPYLHWGSDSHHRKFADTATWQRIYHDCVTIARQVTPSMGARMAHHFLGDGFSSRSLFATTVAVMVVTLNFVGARIGYADQLRGVLPRALDGDAYYQKRLLSDVQKSTSLVKATTINQSYRNLVSVLTVFPRLKLTFQWLCSNSVNSDRILRMTVDMLDTTVRDESFDVNEKLTEFGDYEETDKLASSAVKHVVSGYKSNVFIAEAGLAVLGTATARKTLIKNVNLELDSFHEGHKKFVNRINDMNFDRLAEHIDKSGVSRVVPLETGYVGVALNWREETPIITEMASSGDVRIDDTYAFGNLNLSDSDLKAGSDDSNSSAESYLEEDYMNRVA